MSTERQPKDDLAALVQSGERPSQHRLPEDAATDTIPRSSNPLPPPPVSAPVSPPPPRSSSPRTRASMRLPLIARESYEILGEHARGAIGRILRAKDRRLGRIVAIKELRPEHGKEEERFVREALLTARLEHPAIVPAYEAGRWPSGEPFYAMKLVVGRSLEDLLRESRTIEQRLALLRHIVPVAEAMAYAHSIGIIHRDLKPANVLVGSFGETVVIDWGLAKDMADEPPALAQETTPTLSRGTPIVASEEGLTMLGEVMGTPAYMPPEQARGFPVDERADVYAVGAILYHVLAGQPPYEGAPQDVVTKVVHDMPVPLERRQKGLPPDLLAIVKKAMARSPLERYRTAKELADDLRNYTSGAVVRAHTYTTSDRVSRFVRRNRTAVSVGVVATAVVLALGTVAARRVLSETSRAAAKQREAETAQKEATSRADELVLAEARSALERDPNAAITSLERLSPAFSRWNDVRLLAADAELRGIARLLRGHTGAVTRGALLPDGTLVTGSDDRSMRVWGAPSARAIAASAAVLDLDVSPSGYLVSGTRDGVVSIHRVASGESRVVARHAGPIARVRVTPDGRFVASRARGEHVRVTETASGASVQASEATSEDADLALTVDGNKLAFVSQGKLFVRRVADGAQQTFASPAHTSTCSAFSPSGAELAVGTTDGVVRVFDVASGAYVDLVGHTGAIAEVAFRGAELVTASADRTLRVWDLRSRSARVLRGHDGDLTSVRLSPDGSRAVSASADHTVRLWDLERGIGEVLRGFDDVVAGADFSPDGASVVAWSWDHTVRSWRLADRGARVLYAHAGPAERVVFPDAKTVASSGADRTVRVARIDGAIVTAPQSSAVLDLGASKSTIAAAEDDGSVHLFALDGRESNVLRGHAGPVRALIFSPDGARVATAGADRTVQVWDVASGARVRSFDHGGDIKTLAFSADGKRVASGGSDRIIRIWPLESGAAETWTGHAGEINAIAFSRSGAMVSGSSDRALAMWDASGRAKFIEVSGGGVSHAAFLDDATFATTGADPALRVWDAKTGEVRDVLRAHAGQIVDLDVTHDGKRIVTASTDATVRVWDLAAGSSRVLPSHGDAVWSVAFSPNGKHIASASADHTVRLWSDDLPDDPEGLRAWIHARAAAGR